MNYLSGAFRYVAGGDTAPRVSIPRLVDRLTSAALPQDRRSALSSLVEATKTSPARQTQVGELAVKPLYAVLEQDSEYDDTIKAALDLLLALCATLDPPQNPETIQAMMQDEAQGRDVLPQQIVQAFEQATARAAETNIDMFLGLPGAVSLLLVLLEKSDFYLRFSTIELLTAMAANSRSTLQGALLEAPQGVSRICDLLDDGHRLLRSNAVLLLSTLCDDSPEIAKIVAYAGVLEKLFTLIEGAASDRVESYGGDDDDDDDDDLEAAIVVQDVLYVLRNLIRDASTTRTFFRDTGCLPRLVNLVKRAAADANMPAAEGIETIASGRQSAVEKQVRKNLFIAMQCIAGLAKDNDNETRLVKNDFATTNLFNLLAGLAFVAIPKSQDAHMEKPPEHVLQVRVQALRTLAMLARGHDDFRSMFGSVKFSIAGEGDVTCAQMAALRTMLRDSSSAVRLAAYLALRESFVIDAGLDLPSSNLLNAMTSAGGSAAYSVGGGITSLQRNAMSSGDIGSTGNPVLFVAESLKTGLVDWPTGTDAAGVFYAASLVAWILERVDGARERLLAACVNGSSLLPQVIRVLGKLEREKGPPEVRIALFSLACTWLHGSSSAVSAFLSSAMHLPMLVDVLNGTGARGDVAEVHVRGLSAILLGICLQATDGAHDTANDGGFLSGGGGASMVIPRGTIADVIRNRIGVTVFTACLDDLRASKAFVSEESNRDLWTVADKLTIAENRNGLLSSTGSLGHNCWYGVEVIGVVNDVYKNVGTKVLDLISDQSIASHNAGNAVISHSMTNGHLSDTDTKSVAHKALLADSARDEVLNSYKEFIRSQDESLNAARRQIEELATALRETQRELDTKSNEATAGAESDGARVLQQANDELKAQKEALENLLEEKTKDFTALSDAYAVLEEEQNRQDPGVSSAESAAVVAEVSSLRSQSASVRVSLDSEIAKNIELSHQAALLDNALKAREQELAAMAREREALKSNVQPEVAESLQWRTRAEVAEANWTACQSMLDSVQNAKASLESQLVNLQHSRDASVSLSGLRTELDSARSELEDLQSTRRREQQVARESLLASKVAAEAEISALKDQLAESRQFQARSESDGAPHMNSEALQAYERLKHDYELVVSSLEQTKTELTDTQSAISQWQKRAEKAEIEKDREEQERNRVSKIAHELEGEVRKLNDSRVTEARASSARVVELEQQIAELDEMRQRAGEETKVLKEELAARTEQSIRLSGQLYETEESKIRVEEELQELQNHVQELQTGSVTKEKDIPSAIGPENETGTVSEELHLKIAGLEEQLAATSEALADSKDRQSLAEAQARERDEALSKAVSLEESLSRTQAAKTQLSSEIDDLKQRLLSLDEAEEAKRALTMQVVALQNSLAEVTPGTPSATNTKLLETEEKMIQLQTQIQEKDIRLEGLESSLTDALDRADSAEREKSDVEKQVAEAEAMLSVVSSEREALSKTCEELRIQVNMKPRFSDMDSSILEELEEKLKRAEERRAAASTELSSLVDACRQSEEETNKMRDDNERLREKLHASESELQDHQRRWENAFVKHEVENIVNATILEAAVEAISEANTTVVEAVRGEKDSVVALHNQQSRQLQSLRIEVSGLEGRLRDRDAAIAELTSQGDQLTVKLATLEQVARQRDEIAATLERVEASVGELEKEKGALQERLMGQSSPAEPTENAKGAESASGTSSESSLPSHRRVVELEDALRDAARTVSATNLELISAQALLVELSADKTAMRTELTSAQERIQQLRARNSIDSRPHPTEAALSEVSEQEQSVTEELVSSSNESSEQVLREQSFKTAQAEVENLRTIVERTISEADSASSLLTAIDGKVALVEQKLQSSQSSVEENRMKEKQLEIEMEAMKTSHGTKESQLQAEIKQLRNDLSQVEFAKEEESKSLTAKIRDIQSSASAEKERLQFVVTEKENKLKILEEESTKLKSRLQDASGSIDRLSKKVGVLDEANSKYASTVSTLEGTVSSVNKALDEREQRKNSLEVALQESVNELERKEKVFKSEREALIAGREKEVEELEAEVYRTSLALEAAERKFRNAEVSLKDKVTALETELIAKKEDIASLEEKVESLSETITTRTSRARDLEAELTGKIQSQNLVLTKLTKDKDDTLLLAKHRKSQMDSLETKLTHAEGMVETLSSQMKEEREQKAMLESENQDFMASIEALETTSKRLQDKLAGTEDKLLHTSRKCEESSALADKQARDLEIMQRQLKESNDRCEELQSLSDNLNDEVDGLRSSIESSEKAREAAEQDNSDLKAWVADLERQATDLQTAAENFEDVEQSLRDAIDRQREVAEQNSDLSEELKKERELVAKIEAQLRSAIRDRNSAQAARESLQRRTEDLESRIREIREENLVRFSNSEDAIKAKAQRCAELETKLASAERQLAELATASDSLFGARAELSLKEEDIRRVQERAEAAEVRAEDLQQKVQSMEMEMVEMRESTSGDAYRTLEAEHNELLVCLAEMELECTTLKEELGRE